MKSNFVTPTHVLVLTILTIFTSCGEVDVWGDGKYKFTYNVNESAGTISFTADAETKGWLGFGFSKDNYMPDSDVIMAYIDNSGKAVAVDAYAESRSMPKSDAELGTTQHLTDISGNFKNDRTIIKVTRKLNTDDKYDHEIKKGENIRVLFSVGDDKPTSTTSFTMHNRIKVLSLVLHPGDDSDNENDMSGTSAMDINIGNFKIPAVRTNYYCKFYDIKNMLGIKKDDEDKPKYHAVKFAPIIKTKYLHHIVLYACAEDLGDDYEKGIYECGSSMNIKCSTLITISGPNGGEIITPSEAGFVWGSIDTKIVLMEMHYDNPELVENQIDNSGLKIHYTDKIRKYNMGLLLLGTPYRTIKIPAGKESTVIEPVCSQNCMNKMNEKGIYLSFVALHGHKYLKKTRLEITVDGKTDDTTFRSDSYDFNVQYMNQLNKPMKITRSSKFKTVCDYDTSSATEMILGGEGSDNEMCLAFVGFYPKEYGLKICYDDDRCRMNTGTVSVSAGYLEIMWGVVVMVLGIFIM